MQKIYSSASKLVFVLMAIALIALTAFGIVDAKDFIILAGMAFTFYFSKPSTPVADTTTKTEVTSTTNQDQELLG